MFVSVGDRLENKSNKAPEEEILARLVQIAGSEVMDVTLKASEIIEKNNDKAMELIYAYDATLGGTGVYLMKEKRKLGVYRALSYVKMSMNNPNAVNLTRFAAFSACAYIEALLKKVVHTWFWEKIRPDGLPLGVLLYRYKKHLPPELYENLNWLTKNIYNPAKHNTHFENDENEPENYFSITDSIATYFICRKLGLELERLMGKSQEELESE
ncbi:MAG: hypothetical protein CVU46_13380 [Chloroflexi bacterium HGW-Chloroflexi-8]|jgi:hypothetical protein|nr:MAG: hypothetical protein CVU46_13380 [Chloroflexi bacterium HGW-Chloroflexi-8]